MLTYNKEDLINSTNRQKSTKFLFMLKFLCLSVCLWNLLRFPWLAAKILVAILTVFDTFWKQRHVHLSNYIDAIRVQKLYTTDSTHTKVSETQILFKILNMLIESSRSIFTSLVFENLLYTLHCPNEDLQGQSF